MADESQRTMSSSPVAVPADLTTSAVPAVLEWSTMTASTATETTSDEEKRCIARPDPRSAAILFELVCPPAKSSSHVQDESSPLDVFIQVRIPVKLKHPVGRTHIHVSIRPACIASLAFAADVEAQEDVSDKLPGRLARLTFALRGPVDVIIPANTPVSLLPASTRASGEILDAMRSLGRATSLSVVMPAAQAPRRKLEPLCAALAEGGRGLNPLPRYNELRSLFGGTGGQILAWTPASSPAQTQEEAGEASHGECPPVYAEIGPGPPMPPISTEPEAKDAKRRRASTCSTVSDASSCGTTDHSEKRRRLLEPDMPLPAPESSKEAEAQATAVDAMAQRLMAVFEARFDEQARVMDAQGALIAALRKQNRAQEERMRALEDELAEVRLEAERTGARVEGLDLEVTALGEDARRFEEHTEYWDQDGLDDLRDEITSAVLDAVTERIAEQGLRAHSINLTWAND